ncbi:nucleotide-diphospho-sugar transferase [Larkinella insperata]|uniref:Nucleotide-diphospho-sugar transferase n=1 Tax=Larkinella insperata TaxID=332158 RepID=A0ABW3Q456_9BACT|nr:nucleotide-diphospho-sugar transferase [Larkinella insperata]
MSTQLDIPVLFILFNRPRHARKVLEQIRQAQPKELFIAIDGPRPNHPTDREQVAQCTALLDEIDWPCQVYKLIQPRNLGCKRGVSTAITWFFEQVEMGIILEDDCLPDPSFFTFCRETLLYHQHNSSVMHISGVNFQGGQRHGDGSYFYSKICHIWGWATWRRAWAKYDVSMQSYAEFRQNQVIKDLFTDQKVQQFWTEAFDGVYAGQIDTWDYQWCYTIWTSGGICVCPNQNLISNIGFGQDATHTKEDTESTGNQPLQTLTEIVHPRFLIESRRATEYSLHKFFRKVSGIKQRMENITNKPGLKNVKTTFRKHLLP